MPIALSEPNTIVNVPSDDVLAARHRNAALIPIARLPVDLLSHIFGILVSLDPLIDSVLVGPHTSQIPPQHTSPLRWVTITHVCSLWRAVALEDSRLWFELPSRLGPTWAQEIIRRRRQRDILFFEHVHTISLHSTESHALRQNLHLISNLRVRIEEDDTVLGDHGFPALHTFTRARDEIIHAIGGPANRLECLHLHADSPMSSPLIWLRNRLLFSGQAPLLRRVHLQTNRDLAPNILSSLIVFFPHLTSLVLELRASSDPMLLADASVSLHAALSVARKLERFDLRAPKWKVRESDVAHLDLSAIDFPHMKAYSIGLPISTSTVFIPLARLPELCKVAVVCYITESDVRNGQVPSFSLALSEGFAPVRILEIAGRKVFDDHPIFLGWHISSSDILMNDCTPSVEEGPRPTPDISVSLRETIRNPIRDRYDLLRVLFNRLAASLSGVENLSFHISNHAKVRQIFMPRPDLFLRFIRRNLHSVKWLRMDRYAAAILLSE